MSFIQNKSIIIIILAIIAGGIAGLYLSGANKSKVVPTYVGVWSGASAEKVGEVIKKLNELAK